MRLRGGRPLAIFVDEIDAVRSLHFGSTISLLRFGSFTTGVRRAERPPDVLPARRGLAGGSIAEPALTPFNIGRRIELADFTDAEASRLAWGLDRSPDVAATLLRRVLFWTGAHPYLTQRLCQAVALDTRVTDARGVDRCCRELFLSAQARDRDDNLIFVREQLITRVQTIEPPLLDLLWRPSFAARRRPTIPAPVPLSAPCTCPAW